MFLDKCWVLFRIGKQKYVCLSVTKVQLSAGITCPQDMLYVMWVLLSLGLKKNCLCCQMDNKEAVDWLIIGVLVNVLDTWILSKIFTWIKGKNLNSNWTCSSWREKCRSFYKESLVICIWEKFTMYCGNDEPCHERHHSR